VGTQASLRSNVDLGAGSLCRFDRDAKSFRRFTGSLNSLEGSPENAVIAMAQGFSGNLWIGMLSGDLYRFDSETAAFSYFPERDPKATHVSSLMIAYSGALVVDQKSGELQRLAHKPNDMLFGILEDASGVLWVMTLDAISRYDSDRDTFTNFDQSSGLLNHHFEVNAYFQNQDGLLYFGGTEGLDAFYPFDAR